MIDGLMGRTLGKYQILEMIGQGDMGVVFKGQDLSLKRLVAIKVLKPELTTNPTFVAHFMREASVAAQLNHPNIALVYEVGKIGDHVVIVMEYLPGLSLREIIRQDGALPAGRVARIVSQVAAGLDHAHGRRLVHRDVKPPNIIVAANDTAKLTDFGVAGAIGDPQQAPSSAMGGTLAYMSPEQLKGETVGPAADVYSLGIVAYQALTGRLPFQANTLHSMMWAHVYEPPPRLREISPHVSPDVEKVVLRALDKNPLRRFPSAGAFANALARACAVEYVPDPFAGDPATDVPSARFGRRRLPVLGVAVALVLVAAVAMGVHFLGSANGGGDLPMTPSPATQDPVVVMATAALTVESPTTAQTSTPQPSSVPGQATIVFATALAEQLRSVGTLVDAAAAGTLQSLQAAATTSAASSTSAPEPPPTRPAVVVAPTPRAAARTLQLRSPIGNVVWPGMVKMEWQDDTPLTGNQTYDVRVCKGDGCSPVQSATNVKERTYFWCPTVQGWGEGTYRWQVVVIPDGGASDVAQFIWSGGDCEARKEQRGGGDGGTRPASPHPPPDMPSPEG